MQERWQRFAEKPYVQTRENQGAIFTHPLYDDELEIEMYFIKVDKKGYQQLEEGIYAVLNKTLEEWENENGLYETVSSILTEEFGNPFNLDDTIDLGNLLTGEAVNKTIHDGREWTVLKIEPRTTEVITGLLENSLEVSFNDGAISEINLPISDN